MFNVEFWGCKLEILQSFLKVPLPTSIGKALYDKWSQSSDLFDYGIFLFALYILWGTMKKIRILEPFVIQRPALPFWGLQPNFQKRLQNFEVLTSKFNIERPLTSMTSKTALPNIFKIASNCCIFFKEWRINCWGAWKLI